jgi:hypothetical protein
MHLWQVRALTSLVAPASHAGFDERPTRTEHIWAWRRICQHIGWLRSLRHLRARFNLCRGSKDCTIAMRKRRKIERFRPERSRGIALVIRLSAVGCAFYRISKMNPLRQRIEETDGHGRPLEQERASFWRTLGFPSLVQIKASIRAQGGEHRIRTSHSQ